MGWTLESMDERYGADQSQTIQDAQWIEEATLAGDILLCKDLAITQNPLEAQAIYMTSARVFALSNAGIAGLAMAQWYLDNEAKIVERLCVPGGRTSWRSTRPTACAGRGWLIRPTDPAQSVASPD